MEGLEKAVMCRDEDDYDAMVKTICVCAKRKNVILVIYTVVSNHCHVAVLAATQQDAQEYATELKRIYSMWFRQRYGEAGLLRRTSAVAIWLDSEWYVRNALAYIPRNALDNGHNIGEYKWSGYSAMFRTASATLEAAKRVSSLNKREKRAIMHTCDDLSGVPWLLDSENRLIPTSICDNRFLEQSFNDNQTFFIRTVGSVNSAELDVKLVDAPRRKLLDGELFKLVSDLSNRWFGSSVAELPVVKKARLITYVYRSNRTTVVQLARIFGLSRTETANILANV
ncbi:MAG: transposase [Bacteroidales bacterium]|nr:transposase [Bacteroidales bacterium]